jgi:hypothetical protein
MWAGDSIRCGHLILFDVGSYSVVMWASLHLVNGCEPAMDQHQRLPLAIDLVYSLMPFTAAYPRLTGFIRTSPD